jgi:type III restriction enzyme
VKLQFDPNQSFQLDATTAVIDLFDGQPKGRRSMPSPILARWMVSSRGRTAVSWSSETAILLAEDKLCQNLRAIQTRNDIEVADPSAPPVAGELFDGPANQPRRCPHFSIETKTGRGKPTRFAVANAISRRSVSHLPLPCQPTKCKVAERRGEPTGNLVL